MPGPLQMQVKQLLLHGPEATKTAPITIATTDAAASKPSDIGPALEVVHGGGTATSGAGPPCENEGTPRGSYDYERCQGEAGHTSGVASFSQPRAQVSVIASDSPMLTGHGWQEMALLLAKGLP